MRELIDEIDPELYKKEIIKGKWSIHEHATHVAVGDIYGYQKRMKEFMEKAEPVFEPLSGKSFDKDFFIELDLDKSLNDFFDHRRKSIDLARDLNERDWNKLAIHPEYKTYTPYIMLRHLLMHDHWHMYRIEDMGFGIGDLS